MKVVEDAKQAVQGAASAVMAKAVQMAPDSWMPGGKPDPLIRAQHGHIGRPVSRVDGPVKVRGAAPYAAEFPLDGMLYASLVFSTVAKGTISALDTTAAEAAPGVALVMSYRNAPRMKPMPLFMTAEKACGGNDLPVMQDAKVYWNGEPVALVLAETQEQADHAAALIHVAYEEEHAVTALAEAKAKSGAKNAAAVVLDLRDGGVVASASVPTYDPSVWSEGVSQGEYERLTTGDRSPLIDRVTGVAQPPASTFKAVTLPGAVAAGADLDDEVNCTASHRIGDRTFNNFESRAYGWITWREAIKVSCDTVFYRVADRVWRDQGGLSGDDAGDPLISTARDLGLGAPTGIDLPAESSGRIPDREWKREWWRTTKDASCRAAKRGHPEVEDRTERAYLTALERDNCRSGYQFRPGDEVNLSIGQGDVTATLLQMAQVYGTIATGGTEPSPHLGRSTIAPDGRRTRLDAPATREVDLPGESGSLLRSALGDVVDRPGGTARSAFAGFPLRQWPVAGKTGTAEVYGKEDTAWFVSYAPTTRPRYVVAVVVSQGGTGGGTAAPIARAIHEDLAGVDD